MKPPVGVAAARSRNIGQIRTYISRIPPGHTSKTSALQFLNRHSGGPAEPAGDCRGVWRDVEPLRGQPCVVEVGLGVAFAAVAQQRDDAASLAALVHLVCQGQGTP